MDELAPTHVPRIGRRWVGQWRFRLAFRLLCGRAFVANMTLVLPPGASVEKNNHGPGYMRDCLLANGHGHQTIPGTVMVDVAVDGTIRLHS